jgi:hypothetical protein
VTEKEAALHAATPDRRSRSRSVAATDRFGRTAMTACGRLGVFSSLLFSTSTVHPTTPLAGRNRVRARIDRLPSDLESFPTITARFALPSPFLPHPADLEHKNSHIRRRMSSVPSHSGTLALSPRDDLLPSMAPSGRLDSPHGVWGSGTCRISPPSPGH